jgi:hypothetical protein
MISIPFFLKKKIPPVPNECWAFVYLDIVHVNVGKLEARSVSATDLSLSRRSPSEFPESFLSTRIGMLLPHCQPSSVWRYGPILGAR